MLGVTEENKLQTKRFNYSTDTIDVKKLRRETNGLLAYGFIIAIFFHAAMGILITKLW